MSVYNPAITQDSAIFQITVPKGAANAVSLFTKISDNITSLSGTTIRSPVAVELCVATSLGGSGSYSSYVELRTEKAVPGIQLPQSGQTGLSFRVNLEGKPSLSSSSGLYLAECQSTTTVDGLVRCIVLY